MSQSLKTIFCLALLVVVQKTITVAKDRTEEVSFQSAGSALSGTLLLPKGTGPFPAFVFTHGSGRETRENNFSRARKFVQNGYAVLVYDKRGTGKSGGHKNFNQYFSFDTLATDAVAALEYLANHGAIDSQKIGLIASSQSGWIAPLVAAQFEKLALMIIISGSVSTVGEDNIFERNARLKHEGFSEQDIKEVTEMHLVDIEVSRTATNFEKFEEMWMTNKSKPWFERVYLSSVPMSATHLYRTWYKSVVDFDPVPYLQTIAIPVLWLYGDSKLDRFCPVDLSVERLKKLIADGKNFTIKTIPGASHSLFVKKKDMFVQKNVFEWIKDQNVAL